MFPYLVLRVVRERYLKETNVKKKPSDPNTSRQNTINSVRGSGGGGGGSLNSQKFIEEKYHQGLNW